MLKILVIGAVLGIFLYYSFRRLKRSLGLSPTRAPRKGYISLDADPADIRRAIRSTILTVATGLILLLVTLLLGMKIKILFILLPISLYLIGQIFLLANQMNVLRSKQFWFNPSLSSLWIEERGKQDVIINLYQDISSVQHYQAVQQNRNVLFGYYELRGSQGTGTRLPSLLAESPQNNFFFHTLHESFAIKEHKTLFPLL